MPSTIQLTDVPQSHILTNANCWSPDSQWIVYDTRSTVDGSVFDGTRIERINVKTREVQILYESRNGAHCGVATCDPASGRVVFILGPEHPTPDWSYAATRRQGVIVDPAHPGEAIRLDARDLVPPFTPGALHGGSHVHVFSPDGQWVSFTYEDHVLEQLGQAPGDHDVNQRNVGVSVLGIPVSVPKTHERNHDGQSFTVLVSRTVRAPRPGSDDIRRAFEESWIGVNGYLRKDGTRQRRALAMQGNVLTVAGQTLSEVFVIDLPDDLTKPGEGPLQGTETRLPFPPRGVSQRRLTYTADRKFPGIQGPRHWLRSSPDGSRIAFLMKDDRGAVQLWTISPNGGPPQQLTHNTFHMASAFTWSTNGQFIAHAMDNSLFITDANSGRGTRLTQRYPDDSAPRPEACVFSPDGARIAFVRNVDHNGERFNQIFVTELK